MCKCICIVDVAAAPYRTIGVMHITRGAYRQISTAARAFVESYWLVYQLALTLMQATTTAMRQLLQRRVDPPPV